MGLGSWVIKSLCAKKRQSLAGISYKRVNYPVAYHILVLSKKQILINSSQKKLCAILTKPNEETSRPAHRPDLNQPERMPCNFASCSLCPSFTWTWWWRSCEHFFVAQALSMQIYSSGSAEADLCLTCMLIFRAIRTKSTEMTMLKSWWVFKLQALVEMETYKMKEEFS